MSLVDVPADQGKPPIEAAREIWSQAVAALDQGVLSQRGYESAAQRLAALRGRLRMPERGRVDVYLELLEEAWDDRGPLALCDGEGPDSARLVQAHRVLAAGFADGGDRTERRRRARAALRELERLAAAARDDWERVTIVRLADPLLRLLAALEETRVEEVLQ